MRTVRGPASRPAFSTNVTELRARLDEAEETLRAIRSGGVDALLVDGKGGPRVYTLEGAEHAYRLLIESMNEGALILSADALILYANHRFATMVKRPLARVIGSSCYEFLSEMDQNALKPLLKRASRPLSVIQVMLLTRDGLRLPAQVSVRRLAGNGSDGPAFSMVVTDVTEARRSERMLRSLSQSLLRAQETDRRRLAISLHDSASQSLGALLIRLHLLARNLPKGEKALRGEVEQIGALVGETAEAVEGISKTLRPSVLEILGLVAALRALTSEFVRRTGIAVTLVCGDMPAGLSDEGELVLYRILEEALKNVEEHAKARKVTVRLKRQGTAIKLMIKDDGIGFDSKHPLAEGETNQGMTLIGLRERATHLGGALRIKSARGGGMTLEARIPLRSKKARVHAGGAKGRKRRTARRRRLARPGRRSEVELPRRLEAGGDVLPVP